MQGQNLKTTPENDAGDGKKPITSFIRLFDAIKFQIKG